MAIRIQRSEVERLAHLLRERQTFINLKAALVLGTQGLPQKVQHDVEQLLDASHKMHSATDALLRFLAEELAREGEDLSES